MQTQVFATEEEVARHAAEFIAEAIRRAVAERQQCVVAVSGGSTPWKMLRALASLELPWQGLHLAQVDERVAPRGHADRNLTHLEASLAAAPLPPAQIHPMPVEGDLTHGAEQYERELAALAGSTPVLDLVHLGLGSDGHTASLVPGDDTLHVTDRDVAITGEYQGRQRMTLTYPVLNRARQVLWVATGASKREMVQRLLAGDPSIPAGRVARENAILIADQAAMGGA